MIGIAVLVVLAILQYFAYRYVIGRDGLTVREGLLHRSRREIPFSRIHNVVVHQSLLPRVRRGGGASESAGGRGRKRDACWACAMRWRWKTWCATRRAARGHPDRRAR